MSNVGIGKNIAYYGLLLILCIISFLFAKYMVRSNIGWEKPPVDVSERVK